jgi:hypothetical protein
MFIPAGCILEVENTALQSENAGSRQVLLHCCSISMLYMQHTILSGTIIALSGSARTLTFRVMFYQDYYTILSFILYYNIFDLKIPESTFLHINPGNLTRKTRKNKLWVMSYG